MPVNKNALLRYRAIDRCLSNRQRRWTLQDLIRECSIALGGEPDEPPRVSRRTLQNDLEMMRSGELGYHAPIEVVEKKYYRYADPHFSITNVPVSAGELSRLWEAVELLKQFTGFEHLSEIDSIVERLEARLRASAAGNKQKYSVVELDNSPSAQGAHLIPPLTQWLQEGHVLLVRYQAFGRKPITIRLHGYLIKEYHQRWYLVGYEQLRRQIMNLPLDRILHVQSEGAQRFIPNTFFDPKTYYRDTIGITVFPHSKPQEILIWSDKDSAPYLLTKPLHVSQTVVRQFPEGDMVISLFVRNNMELMSELLSWSGGVMVLKPAHLRKKLEACLRQAVSRYADETWRAALWQRLNAKAGADPEDNTGRF